MESEIYNFKIRTTEQKRSRRGSSSLTRSPQRCLECLGEIVIAIIGAEGVLKLLCFFGET